MADKSASLIITLKDLASSGLGRLVGEFQKFKVGVMSAYDAVKPFVDFLVSSVKSYMEAESAVNKLNQSLRAQGITSKEVSNDLQNYAKELQNTTAFSDEAILETESLLTTFGLFGDDLKKVTKSALDLSVGLGIDLRTSTLLLGKAAAGETGALSRYGIQIDENASSAEKLNAVQQQIEKRFGGAAQAQLDSYSGKILNLKNRYDELKEKVGAEMVPVMEYWVGALEKAMQKLDAVAGGQDNLKSATERHIAAMQYAREQLIINSTMEGTYHEERTQRQIAAFNEEIMRLQQKVTIEKQAIADVVTAENDAATRRSEIRKRQHKENMDALMLQIQGVGKYNKEVLSKENERIKAEDELRAIERANKISVLQGTFAQISSLQTSHNKGLIAIGKAAAIADIGISTAQGIGRAWALGPILGPVLATLVAVAGAAQAAKVGGINLAEGGIVMPRAGGVRANIAEAGSPEAVIPLGDERAREKLQESGLGGQTVVNLNIGYLIGNDNNVRELARIIDKELFTLRRNNESVAFEAL